MIQKFYLPSKVKYQPKVYLNGTTDSNISVTIYLVTYTQPENKHTSRGEMNSPSGTF